MLHTCICMCMYTYIHIYTSMCICIPIYTYIYTYIRGTGGSVSIAPDYGLDGQRIESQWGQDFPPFQTGPGAQTASCTKGNGSFPGVKCGRGVLLTTHPLLAPRSWKSRAIPLPPLWGTTRPVTGLLYFYWLMHHSSVHFYDLVFLGTSVNFHN